MKSFNVEYREYLKAFVKICSGLPITDTEGYNDKELLSCAIGAGHACFMKAGKALSTQGLPLSQSKFHNEMIDCSI